MTSQRDPQGNPFEGAEPYYARYRRSYPSSVLNLLRFTFGLDGAGRLLDLGCGTGQLALALHADVAEVVALDISAEMLREGRRLAAAAGAGNITWLVSAAEALPLEPGGFRLITLGSSFHWMDRPAVLNRCLQVLEPTGGMAVMSAPSLSTIWREDRPPWEQAVVRAVQYWLGRERRAGNTTYVIQDRHEDALAQAGLQRMEQGIYEWRRILDADAVLGELYSSSFCNPRLLGPRAAAFEAELRQALAATQPDGAFEHVQSVDYIFAWR